VLGRGVDVGRLQTAIDAQLVARGLVQVAGEEMQLIPRVSPLLMRVTLLPASVVHAVTRRLTWLMPDGVWFWVLFVPVVALAFVSAQRAIGPADPAAATSIRLSAFALMVLSTLAHELGHATACTKSGARAGDIGFGIYWYFPVLFTNLDDVWRLDRWHRARVDAAGLFFQCGFIALAGLVAAQIPGAGAIFAGLPVLLAVTVVYALNPLLRFDGYWLLCDLSGVPNLRAASQQALRALMGRGIVASGRDRAGEHAAMLGGRARRALALYAGASVVFATALAVIGIRLFSRWIETGGPARLGDTLVSAGGLLRRFEVILAFGRAVQAVELFLPAVIASLLIVGSVRNTRAFVKQMVG
jgi:hypothetical protein